MKNIIRKLVVLSTLLLSLNSIAIDCFIAPVDKSEIKITNQETGQTLNSMSEIKECEKWNVDLGSVEVYSEQGDSIVTTGFPLVVDKALLTILGQHTEVPDYNPDPLLDVAANDIFVENVVVSDDVILQDVNFAPVNNLGF
jgi:hypothetical protein